MHFKIQLKKSRQLIEGAGGLFLVLCQRKLRPFFTCLEMNELL